MLACRDRERVKSRTPTAVPMIGTYVARIALLKVRGTGAYLLQTAKPRAERCVIQHSDVEQVCSISKV